jgi:hypothetical protein
MKTLTGLFKLQKHPGNAAAEEHAHAEHDRNIHYINLTIRGFDKYAMVTSFIKKHTLSVSEAFGNNFPKSSSLSFSPRLPASD